MPSALIPCVQHECLRPGRTDPVSVPARVPPLSPSSHPVVDISARLRSAHCPAWPNCSFSFPFLDAQRSSPMPMLRARAPPPKSKITTLASSPNSNKQASRPRAARKTHKTSENHSAVRINKYERGGAETTPQRQATGDLASIARHASLLIPPRRTRHDYRHASAHYDPTGSIPRLFLRSTLRAQEQRDMLRR